PISLGICIDPDLDHHPGVIGRISPFLLIRPVDFAQVQLVHDLAQEVGQMVLGQPVPQGWWKQQRVSGLIRSKGLHTAVYSMCAVISLAIYSHSLLGAGSKGRTRCSGWIPFR